jgi:drug/metabolite transporter (DMT)-like permease
LAILAGLLAVAFWGASFAATKIALRQLTPPTLVFLRTSIGILVLALVAASGGSGKTHLNVPWMRLLALGFLGVAFHQWLQAYALRFTSTTNTGWIIATIPIFAALLGWRFLGERMPIMRILGIGLGALGVVTVISGGHPGWLFEGLRGQIGDAYILLSAINWAVFTVLSKRWLFGNESVSSQQTALGSSSVHMIHAMLRLMIMGWAIILPWVIADQGLSAIQHLTGTTVGAMLFLGIACSGLAYIFWYAALTRLEATETSALLYFEPLVTQAVAWSYLGEPMSLGIILGGGVILLGVWLVGRG